MVLTRTTQTTHQQCMEQTVIQQLRTTLLDTQILSSQVFTQIKTAVESIIDQTNYVNIVFIGRISSHRIDLGVL